MTVTRCAMSMRARTYNVRTYTEGPLVAEHCASYYIQSAINESGRDAGMSSRASADSATVRKVKAIQAKKRKGKIAKKPPENKLR